LTDFLLPRTYEAAIAGIDPGSDPDPMLAWHSSFAGSREGNLGDVIDPILDELASAARTTAGVDARHDLYGSFTTRFRELVPGIVLLGESATYLIAPALAGFEQVAITDPSWRFAGVHRWRLAGPR
jgi:ABC-type transport system substrate-binding protein